MYGNGGRFNGNGGGMNNNGGNNGGNRGRPNGIQCYDCGKYGHYARDCCAKRGKPAQHDDELHVFVRDLMKEKVEERKKKEEEQQKAREEEERRREMDMARRTEEMRLQLQADIAEKWRLQQEEATLKARELDKKKNDEPANQKLVTSQVPSTSKGIAKKYGKKGKAKKISRKKKDTKRYVESLDSSSSSETEESDSSEGETTESRDESPKIRDRRRRGGKKSKVRRKQARLSEERSIPWRTIEKGECSRRTGTPSTPPATPRKMTFELKTPLSEGYKGIPAGCSKEGFMDYTLAVLKQYSAKKAMALKVLCTKYGIKATKKKDMVMELVRRQTKLAYEGYFTTPLTKKTTTLKIGRDEEKTPQAAPEAGKSTMTT
ncbi:hypothetical protein CBR_g653 [Chara braunii]|uniref:CCHC-type domain-containing protein n=1 Tax=Chara braunii TaxID=69332 RepID=A0A388KC48_CHABU|nr:hypothetical protein CBR_g653 [Chara braunii]|eukprot:GBG67523.1 hypothetical protein CBR_g653 [Chara braunii]